MLLTVIAFLVVLGVLIFVHEFGHFIAAKWAGIYIHRFSIGMGAPIKALTRRRGETEYVISWLPLGGYVKMASREEEALSSSLEGGAPEVVVPPDRVFEAKPVWKRMIVILAGVTMNMLFAYLIYTGLTLQYGGRVERETRVGSVEESLVPPGGEALLTLVPGDQIIRVDGDTVSTWEGIQSAIQNSGSRTVHVDLADGRTLALEIHPDALAERIQAAAAMEPRRDAVVDAVLAGGPAARAGVQSGDSIVQIDDEPIGSWADLQRVVEARPLQELTIQVVRQGAPLVVRARTDSLSIPTADGGTRMVGRLQIGPRVVTERQNYAFGAALAEGGRRTVEASTQIVRTVRGLLRGRVAGRELGGPILIGQIAGQALRLGPEAFLTFMALISVNLAVLNLLPIPLLDGGQFLFLLAEGVMRRPLSLPVRERLAQAGFVVLILIMVFAFSNDIRRLIAGWLG